MRRRHTGVYWETPAALRAFDPDGPLPFEVWKQARKEWAIAHGWLGGIVRLLREDRAVRRGEPMPQPGYPYWCPPQPENFRRKMRE